MARKFKKKLAPKRITKKTAVLSVEIIGKEYLQKVSSFWDKFVSKAKTFKLSN